MVRKKWDAREGGGREEEEEEKIGLCTYCYVCQIMDTTCDWRRKRRRRKRRRRRRRRKRRRSKPSLKFL